MIIVIFMSFHCQFSYVLVKSCILNVKFDNQIYLALPESAWVSRAGNEGIIWVMDSNTNRVSKKTVYTDKNGFILRGVDENDLIVDVQTIEQVPFLWGPAILEVQVWR